MKKLLVLLVAGTVGYYVYTHQDQISVAPKVAASAPKVTTSESQTSTESSESLSHVFDQRLSNVQVEGSGVVDKILSDDNEGSKHQRFIVRLASGQTVLIAHNIDLAARISSLSVGDQIQFSGEYEWNNKGGVVHWTHRDPEGRHQSGWIKHNGETIQ